MVCHETYKDTKGNWLYPEEIMVMDDKNIVKKTDKTKVSVGPSESMSKSKKNTVDPEVMIERYGADAVRWFILSDSPPEKDIQWSDSGVNSSNKFLQKLWNLCSSLIVRKAKGSNKELEENLNLKISELTRKIDRSINEFKFNVSIALFYETYKIFNRYSNEDVSNKILKINFIKIIKLMIPFVPHLSNECLELLKCKDKYIWPIIDKTEKTEINFAIQVNGKTRDIITINKDLNEKNITQEILTKSKARKYLENVKIIKTIFIKGKIINYITK